jgi:ribulose kinase
MTRKGKVFQPHPEHRQTYEQLYRRVYRKMYARLQPLYREIAEITGYGIASIKSYCESFASEL